MAHKNIKTFYFTPTSVIQLVSARAKWTTTTTTEGTEKELLNLHLDCFKTQNYRKMF